MKSKIETFEVNKKYKSRGQINDHSKTQELKYVSKGLQYQRRVAERKIIHKKLKGSLQLKEM